MALEEELLLELLLLPIQKPSLTRPPNEKGERCVTFKPLGFPTEKTVTFFNRTGFHQQNS